ncbi:hypothetical protein [Vibrio aestuarianus]|uniref:hypothetical protein n=1 Tax=Vibrio aestuarianus TaxID=28171 RepID=UPI00237CEA12|nr:hypothetical protein [Vibrio aestuarianus]
MNNKQSDSRHSYKPNIKDLMSNTDFKTQRNDPQLQQWSKKARIGQEKLNALVDNNRTQHGR